MPLAMVRDSVCCSRGFGSYEITSLGALIVYIESWHLRRTNNSNSVHFYSWRCNNERSLHTDHARCTRVIVSVCEHGDRNRYGMSTVCITLWIQMNIVGLQNTHSRVSSLKLLIAGGGGRNFW